MAIVTLDPVQTDTADITLSNGNLTAFGKQSGTQQYQFTEATNPISGKCYWETFWNLWSVPASGTVIGLAPYNYEHNGTIGSVLGINANCAGYRCGGTAPGATFFYIDNTGFESMPAWAQGNTVQVAVDASGQNFWGNVNNANNWNSSGGTASPGAGTGGYGLSALSGIMYPTFQIDGTIAYEFTVNFGATPFAYTPPTGFSGLSTPGAATLMGQAMLHVISDGERVVREWFRPKPRPKLYLPPKLQLILPEAYA